MEMNSIKNSQLRKKLAKIYEILTPLWPDAMPLLHYRNCFELLCSVVLSAQCTDEQVNAVTPVLFSHFPDAKTMAEADIEKIESIIRSTGFYHAKARHLSESAKLIMSRYNGQVPQTIEELVTLPGVGRKTANLVVSACFGIPGVIVDTHVMRTAVRMGICDKPDPELIERTIRQNLPDSQLTAFSHALNRHGKHVCSARRPLCLTDLQRCPVANLCERNGVYSKTIV